MSVFANTGQDCCARSRVFVERPVYEKFVELFVQATRKIVVGDPAKAETQVGPLVSAQQRESGRGLFGRRPKRRVSKSSAAAIVRRARVIISTRPCVLGCETSDRDLARGDFWAGCLHPPFDREEEMLAEVNASPYGLSGSLWTNDLKRALRVARRVESGVLSVNCHNSVHLEAPVRRIQTKRPGPRPRHGGDGGLFRTEKHLHRRLAMNLAALKTKIARKEIDTV